MNDRYVVTSKTTGAEVALANSMTHAEEYQKSLGGQIIDRHAPAGQAVS